MRFPLRTSGRRWGVVLAVASLLSMPASAFAAGSETATPPKWSITPMPSSSGLASLAGVSCPTASRCVAVGTTGRYALAEVSSGNAWTVTHSPYVGSSASLAGVSCVSATHCFAVGTFWDGHTGQPLAETWNGTTWSATPAPRAEAQGALLSVSCPSATRCVAVGETGDSGGESDGLAETWDGSHWSLMHVHDQPLGSTSTLTGVSCATRDILRCGRQADLPRRSSAAAHRGMERETVGDRTEPDIRIRPRPVPGFGFVLEHDELLRRWRNGRKFRTRGDADRDVER